MSFAGFLESSSSTSAIHSNGNTTRSGKIVSEVQYNMLTGAIAPPHMVSPPLSTNIFTSRAVQQQTADTQTGGFNRSLEGLDSRKREDNLEQDSRSGSDNFDGGSGDDHEAADKPRKKKRYHRHTPQQIQELEALFKECPHPDEKRRLELSKKLSLGTRQVKFWFQNRRTQMKTQLERHENSLLRQENDKLRAENMSIRETMQNPICCNCGGPAIIGDISVEEQHLRIENARLKDELDRVCTLASKFLGRPISSLTQFISNEAFPAQLPRSTLELGIGSNELVRGDFGHDFLPPSSASERPMLLELALTAMDELMKLAQADEQLWMRMSEHGGSCHDILNREEYAKRFPQSIGVKSSSFVAEASRATTMVITNCTELVETLMDSDRWAETYPCIVARTSTIEVISRGMGGTRNGSLQMMEAELQVLSPLVPIRKANFLRFCKQHAEGMWAVVDVSIRETSPDCRRLPSGCVVQEMPNGYSKVTWVEHAEYDETQIHHLYRPLISSGLGFGAQRWLATLQRQFECLAVLTPSAVAAPDNNGFSSGGRRSMMKLAKRMTDNFCAGVCASTVHRWNKLKAVNIDDDVRVMTRNSIDNPGEPPGIVLSAATSVWLPVAPHRLFDFLRDDRLRSEWDILSNGGPMQEMAHIAKGPNPANCVSLLRASTMNPNQSSMLILQETCIDASGSLVVYAPVDIPAIHMVMNGGDSAYVALLPSGFSIFPSPAQTGAGGSLLTVAFQILVNSQPTAKLTVESVETVNNLISCTVQKIKAALGCKKTK